MEMKPLFDHYREQRTVFAPDLPGFGLSRRGRCDYTPGLYADAILEFLQSAVGRPADVVALSLSAEFAARAALQEPGLFASLTLISPTGLGRREPPGETTSARLHRIFTLPLLDGSLFRLLTSRASIRYFLNLNFEGRAPGEMIDYAWATAHQPGARHAPFAFLSGKLFTRGARTKLYRPLQVPVLVLHDEDPNVSFDCLPQLLAGSDYWQAERIRPTRGLPHWEQPEQTVTALDTFWRGVGGRRGTGTGTAG
jgi:pimeloyl-ACP methyl ester carboxylesterase